MKKTFLTLCLCPLSLSAEVIPTLNQAIQTDNAYKKINQQLVSVSKQNRQTEMQLSENEKKLSELDKIRRLKTDTLKKMHEQMQGLISAIGRLSRHGPDNLLQASVTPDELIRGVILMRSLMKWAHQNNLDLQHELGNCTSLRQEMDTEKTKLEQNYLALQKQSQKMKRLLTQRRALIQKELKKRRKIAEQIKRMAEKAKSIRELVGKISNKQQHQSSTTLAPDTSGRYEILPAQGTISKKFGEVSPENLDGLGVLFKTRPGAWVIAPTSGQIVFAGAFRQYPNMIIIKHKRPGYFTILAGLGSLSADVGQTVDTGEPLGTMPSNAVPHLYLELRKNDQTLNPMQWITGIQ
ncbi:MAG: hypothetical protein CMM87_02690 [Rickettsiales bacterium]|nr:hypothetical protein [Rickettsiales bacterium]|tara:strand:- start:7407 stop:8459 length:1053 start_codon:yes stop_codon:yes gene_type:complete